MQHFKMATFIWILPVFYALFSQSQAANIVTSSFVSCPDPANALSANLVAERLVDEAGKFLGTLTKEIALPETGLFPTPISCILITDLSGDGSGGRISITGGGVKDQYVHVTVVSKFSKGLKYKIQVFAPN
ncbi:unnamed protein product [Acanthoscelides obtectus]|uniref:Uncharacterized protein n=1 Tax=Acanthoscelides obtectus TaxID=200917 RepID=A0A9P0PGY9_ACAOB|nr:unnamed protein product [Acanthoscelides obtectus]CAK1677642.1 hypothetical protein AOBTE_LOCUS31454 [Acanthoscelides obtectus]